MFESLRSKCLESFRSWSHSGAGVVGVTPEQVFGVTPELEKVFGVTPELE